LRPQQQAAVAIAAEHAGKQRRAKQHVVGKPPVAQGQRQKQVVQNHHRQAAEVQRLQHGAGLHMGQKVARLPELDRYRQRGVGPRPQVQHVLAVLQCQGEGREAMLQRLAHRPGQAGVCAVLVGTVHLQRAQAVEGDFQHPQLRQCGRLADRQAQPQRILALGQVDLAGIGRPGLERPLGIGLARLRQISLPAGVAPDRHLPGRRRPGLGRCHGQHRQAPCQQAEQPEQPPGRQGEAKP